MLSVWVVLFFSDELRKEAKKLKRELLGKNKKPEEIDQSKMGMSSH